MTVNGEAARPSTRVLAGDTVRVKAQVPPSLNAAPEHLDLQIVYEDESLAVIDKPAGLVVHPAAGHASGTLVNALVSRYPHLEAAGSARPGIVHRLDKDTSGLMVVALSPQAQLHLADQLRRRTMHRTYTALVWGRLEPERAMIDVPIGRDPSGRRRMAAGPRSIAARDARTRYRVLQYLSEFSLLEVDLETGRTHQIRVHLAYVGHPIVGDGTYANRPWADLNRQFLHASKLELQHPTTSDGMTFTAPLPRELTTFLDAARRVTPD